MFEVPAEETIALAQAEGLRPRLQEERGSIQAANRMAGVTWTISGLRKGQKLHSLEVSRRELRRSVALVIEAFN